MYLYLQWKRYTVTEDLSMPPKKEAVKSLLDACESLRLRRIELEDICPMMFSDLPKIPVPVIKEYYPYLNSLMTKSIFKWRQVVEVENSSIVLFKAAYKTWNRFEWIYTYDVSYENIVRKELGMEEVDGDKKMLLVPNCFKSIAYLTALSEEKYIPIENKITEVNETLID